MKQRELKEKYLRQFGWKKEEGYAVHPLANCEWEETFVTKKQFEDSYRECSYWWHPDYDEQAYDDQDIDSAVDYEDDQDHPAFSEWKRFA